MATFPTQMSRPASLQGLDWASLSPQLQDTLTNAVGLHPDLGDADINQIILQDPTERLQWQSSPGGYNAGQMAAIFNARGKSIGPRSDFPRETPGAVSLPQVSIPQASLSGVQMAAGGLDERLEQARKQNAAQRNPLWYSNSPKSAV